MVGLGIVRRGYWLSVMALWGSLGGVSGIEWGRGYWCCGFAGIGRQDEVISASSWLCRIAQRDEGIVARHCGFARIARRDDGIAASWYRGDRLTEVIASLLWPARWR